MKLVLNNNIESKMGTWEFQQDAKTGKAMLCYYKPDSDAPDAIIPVTMDEMADLRTLFDMMDKYLKSLEIERKFVLTKLPHGIPDDVIVINQFYGVRENQDFRIRQSMGLISGLSHVYTEKTLVTDGVFIEDERALNAAEFQELKANCTSVIRKTRFVYGIPGTNLKWEVDNYHDMKLVTAEIELPYIDYPYLLETYMENVIDFEATGKKKYFNSTLAVPYKPIEDGQ